MSLRAANGAERKTDTGVGTKPADPTLGTAGAGGSDRNTHVHSPDTPQVPSAETLTSQAPGFQFRLKRPPDLSQKLFPSLFSSIY